MIGVALDHFPSVAGGLLVLCILAAGCAWTNGGEGQ